MLKSILFAAAIIESTSYSQAQDDWPQWRHDERRTSSTNHELPNELELKWSKQMATPKSAFSHDPRTEIDRSYEPVAMDGVLYIPSMVTDSVTAVKLDSGKKLWQFFTGGPVRCAPIAWKDKLYLASDDGYLYCLNKENGEVNWKFRAVPDDRKDYKFHGNERLISRWPIRSAPLLHKGHIYFSSGLWPAEGVFAFCLDAETGKQVWMNPNNAFIKDGLNDHGRKIDFGLSPNGYGAVCGDTVTFTTGRALNAFHNLETGEREPYTTGYGKSSTSIRGSL